MSKSFSLLASGAVALATLGLVTDVAAAAPVSPAFAAHSHASIVEQVQYRRGWRGRGVGWGIGAGILGGAIIGSALARPYYYERPYYAYPRAYYPPGPTYYAPAPPPIDDEVEYCLRRFRSYDPRSGTYLGFDGFRHPCP